ncbi:MAG: hypothetical protein WCG13_18870 [Burkholderiales bacterium]
MRLATFALSAALTMLSAACDAEVLHNIEPLDTLGSIKKKYPNATLTRVKAAWVTEDQDFFRLEGSGFPGELMIAFRDGRAGFRLEAARKREEAIAAGKSEAGARSVFEDFANESDDEALSVDWVRWVPSRPIPLERYKSKYGEPTKCDFTADSMAPFCQWMPRLLLVMLTDDKKLVLSVEAAFTKAERRAAWLKRHGFVPNFLKEEPTSQPPGKNAIEKKPPAAKP